MASVGEGAARGLESGFRLAMDVHERQRQADRQERSDARQLGLDSRAEAQQGLQNTRQATLDARVLEDHDYNRERQVNADERVVLDRRRKELATRVTVPTTDPATLDAINNDVQSLRDDETAWMARSGGATNTGAAAKAQAMTDEAAAVKAGTAPPAVMLKHAVRAARVPMQHLVRKDGQPSVVDQIVQAQMGDDPQAKIKGWNVLLHQDLQVGVGQASPHGGTIVRKDISNLVPDPNNPDRVIPTLKVWIKGERSPDSGDEMRARRARVLGPDAPADATGFYEAPMTDGRSADRKADDKVKSVSVSEGMARLDSMMQLVEAVNAPEGQQAMAQLMAEQQAQGAADPVAKLKAARAWLGVTDAPKGSIDEFTLKPGDVRVRRRIDAQGNVVSGSEQREQGNPKVAAGLQATLDAIDGMDISETDKATLSKAAAAAKGPKGKGLSTGAGGGGGGGGGTDGLTAAQKRLRDADRTEAKDKADRAEKAAIAAETAVRDFYASTNLATGSRSLKDKVVVQEGADLTAAAKKARARAASLSDGLDKLDAAPAAAAPPWAPRPKPGAAAGPGKKDYSKLF